MALAYNEWDQRTDTIVAGIKQKILASTDWTHLQLTTGTQATTLTATASAGATQVQTNTTIPSGSYITIGNGAANPEVRLTTGVSGSSGAFIVTFNAAEPLVGTYSSGAAVGVGSYVKAVTTRGAQMVVDLAASAPTVSTVSANLYQSHDGTTAGTALAQFITFRASGGAAANILHCRVSAAKDWLYVDVEGPRGGETGAASGSLGSHRQMIYLGDLVPYDSADTTPAVVAIGGQSASATDSHSWVRVSRNRDNTQSWVYAFLRTLTYPQYTINQTSGNQPAAARSGDFVQAPCVIFEVNDGLRGRLQYLDHGGFNFMIDPFDTAPVQQGAEMIYGSYRYRALFPFKTDGGSSCAYGVGAVGNGNSVNYPMSPVLWVPVAVYP